MTNLRGSIGIRLVGITPWQQCRLQNWNKKMHVREQCAIGECEMHGYQLCKIECLNLMAQ